MNIYVGNLDYSINDNDLRNIFEEYGQVEKATVIMDRFTGKGKGFGFVEMPDETESKNAIETLDGAELEGRTMKVNMAKPREERPRRSLRM